MITSRRRFFLGASASLIAAPAIVRVAANLMPVSAKFNAGEFLPGLLSREEVAFLDGMAEGVESSIHCSVPYGRWRLLNQGVIVLSA